MSNLNGRRRDSSLDNEEKGCAALSLAGCLMITLSFLFWGGLIALIFFLVKVWIL